MKIEKFTIGDKTYEIRESFNHQEERYEVRLFDGQTPVGLPFFLNNVVESDGNIYGHNLREELFRAAKNHFMQICQ